MSLRSRIFALLLVAAWLPFVGHCPGGGFHHHCGAQDATHEHHGHDHAPQDCDTPGHQHDFAKPRAQDVPRCEGTMLFAMSHSLAGLFAAELRIEQTRSRDYSPPDLQPSAIAALSREHPARAPSA